MAQTGRDGFDPRRIENPFSAKFMTQDEVDQFAREIASRKGLEKYERTFVKAGRILQHGWQSLDQKLSDEGSNDGVVETLSPKEREDLEQDETEALFLKQSSPPWRADFWTRGRGMKTKDRSSLPGATVADGIARVPHSIFWRQPKELRTTIITLCVAAVVQGWNQTATNGANLTWSQGLGLTDTTDCDYHGRAKWYFAFVNAVPYLAAAVFAVILSDPLNELFFGRRSAICVSAALILASSIGASFVHNTWEFLLCRIILGIGMGCKASVVPVFAAEVAPARIRGSLVMNWQLFDALGIFLGFTANLIVSPLGTSSWRAMTASSVVPTLVLLSLGLVACPESPRFLISRENYHAAFETLSRLRGSRLLAAKELLYTHRQLHEENKFSRNTPAKAVVAGPLTSESGHLEQASASRDSPGRASITEGKPYFYQKLWQLFSIPRIRNATVTAVVCMISQQLCGVNVLIFFSSTIFSDATGQGCGSEVNAETLIKPLFISWGIGLLNLIFGIPAYWLIDRMGRRWLLLATMPLMTLFMGAASLTYINGSHHIPLGIFVYLFMVVYSPGMGPVPFTISAEVFPLDHRVAGMSIAVFTNLFGAGVLAAFVPVITSSALGHAGLLGVFTFLNVLAFILVFLFVRETAGTVDADNPDTMTALALEELYRIFSIPMRSFMRYQVTEILPWWWHYFTWKTRSILFGAKEDVEDQRGDGMPDRPVPVHLWQEMERSANGSEKPTRKRRQQKRQ